MLPLRGLFFSFLLSCLASLSYGSEQTLLLRQPAVSSEHIAFVYGGDIWLSDRSGNNSRRLSSHPAVESHPSFSPDGKWLAFTASYDGNKDVYVVPIEGGQPKRLTWHADEDIVNGWSADGTKIVFTSAREISHSRSRQIYHISPNGGYPQKMMDGIAFEGAWSNDGKRFAYNPHKPAYYGNSGWRQHRGGATPRIWIIDPDIQRVEKIPHDRSNDFNPMWLGEHVYFISDRNDGAANLFRYDTTAKTLTQLTKETVWDIRSADAVGQSIVYEVGGRLKELNVNSLVSKEIVVSVKPDSAQLRRQWKNAGNTIQKIALSPTGKRVLLTARGDVFTVPVKDGSTRNLTNSSGIREKDAIWSPKGDKIAYISDEGSEHRLIITPQSGMGPTKGYALGDTAYYTLLAWAIDAKRIIYQDNHLNVYSIVLADGKRTLITSNNRRNEIELALSPDGRWIAYTLSGENHLSDIYLYNFDKGKQTQLTDGMVHAASPSFSKDGKLLFFTASNNAGPQQVGLDMSTQERSLRSGIYAVVLARDGKSPLLPVSDEEKLDRETKSKQKKKDGNAVETVVVKIDLNGIRQRIVALPIPERRYTGLSVANDGSLYYIEQLQPGISNELPGTDSVAVNTLYRFDIDDRESKVVKADIADYVLSDDGKHLLILAADNALLIAKAEEKIEPEPVDLTDVRSLVDPRQEWAQIFDETWRMERDYFYDSSMHGLDWHNIKVRYQTLLPHVVTREDLNQLLVEMIAEMQVGHNRVSGGDTHRENRVMIGLLGADLRVDNGYYRIKKIYTGENWNPFLKAPLAAPGLGVSEGDYIIAINGKDILATENIFARFEGTVGKQVTLTINKRAQKKGAKEIVVEPVKSERELRLWSWIERNRQYVSNKSGGRVGYIYLPNTYTDGFRYFNRMYFAQTDKDALIIDERRNGGGQAANYITDVLTRQYLASWKDRAGLTFDTPGGAVYGPKVMLIDQDAGSGGDFLPYSFRRLKIGSLIGTRTWGGLIGISANPDLIDGGNLVVPFFRFYTPEGQWAIENEGVTPDIEVQLETTDVNRGIDTQLDRAIEDVIEQLKTFKPIKRKVAPAMPVILQ